MAPGHIARCTRAGDGDISVASLRVARKPLAHRSPVAGAAAERHRAHETHGQDLAFGHLFGSLTRRRRGLGEQRDLAALVIIARQRDHVLVHECPTTIARRRGSQTLQVGVALAMERRIAEGLLGDPCALEEQPDLLGIGHADTAVQLHRLAGDEFERLAGLALGETR